MGVAGTNAKEKPVDGRLLYNLRMPCTVRNFCFVAFFTCLTLANWSSQEARGQVSEKKYACQSAIQATTPKWETDRSHRSDVIKAKRLGLSERDCARLTGRFGESQLRQANSNLEKPKAKKPKAEASKKTTSTTSKDIKSLQKTVTDLKNNINVTRSLLNKNQTKYDRKISKLQKQIKDLLSENKNLSKNLINVQSTSKNARESLEKKQSTLEKEVAGFDMLFRETAGSNNAIRKAMSDLETSLSSRSTRLERRLNETQRDFKTLERTQNQLVDQTEKITETLKTPKGEKEIPNIESVASSEDTSAPGIEMTDLLIYLIPAMLFLGGLGVIVLVMVRKNRDRKRLEAEALRHSSANNTPKPNNNGTPSAAPGPWEKTESDTTKTT